MGLFSKKENKNKSTPKPIAGPTPPPGPNIVNSNKPAIPEAPVAPMAPMPAAPSVATPPPAGNNFASAPSIPGTPAAPSFGPGTPPPPAGFKPATPGAPSFGTPVSNSPFGAAVSPVAPMIDDEPVPERKFDIFKENQMYVKFDFSKLKIDKLDLATKPEPRQIRKHIKKLLELQKQLINMEKDLVCRRDFLDKYIFEEKENQKPKILVDLLEGKDPNQEQSTEAVKTEDSNTKADEKKTTDKKELKHEIKKFNKEKGRLANSDKVNEDVFKSVEDMLSK